MRLQPLPHAVAGDEALQLLGVLLTRPLVQRHLVNREHRREPFDAAAVLATAYSRGCNRMRQRLQPRAP